MTPQRVSHLDEQFPLSPLDDHLVHQTPDPMRVMWSSDPRAFDRHIAILHDDEGEIMVVIGGSFYPNLGTAEAYAIVNVAGDHRSVRAFRSIGSDRTDLHIGPIQPTIVEGLRTWNFVVEPNDWGISLNLTWTDTKRQVYGASWSSLVSGLPRGSQRQVTAGFEGFGVADGWVEVDGVRRDVKMRGSRDRHWGIGRGIGGPAMNGGRAPRPGWKGGNWIDLADLSIWGPSVLYDFGDPRPGKGRVVDVQRRLRFDEETKMVTEGVIDFRFADGDERTVEYERLDNQTAFMRCGLYGGTVDGRFQGVYVGEDVVEGDRFDVTDPRNRLMLSGLNEHHCRIRSGGQVTTGIIQPVEPDAYWACVNEEPGWALWK